MRLLLYVLVAVALTYPAWQEGGVIGRAEGELRDHLWVAWMVQHRLEQGALPLFFPEANVPKGLALYPLDPLNHLAFYVLSPLGLLGAVRLWSVLLLALVGVGAERLSQKLGATTLSAWMGGLLCMMGPPVLGAWVDTQTEGMGVGWMLLLFSELVEEGPWSRGRTLRAALWGCLLAASAPYQAHAVALVAGGIALWKWRWKALWAAIPSGVVAFMLGWAMISSEGKGQLDARLRAGDWPPSIIVGAEVAPRSESINVNFFQEVSAYEHTALRAPPTTGPRNWIGVLLPLITMVVFVRERRHPARWMGWLVIGYFLLSLGSAKPTFLNADGRNWIPLPFDLWYRYYPLGRLSWKPAQYAIQTWIFAVALSAAMGRKWFPLAALAMVAELQWRGSTPAPLPAIVLKETPWMSALAKEEGGAVLEFPSRARSREGVDRMPADVLLGPLFHHRALGEAFGRGGNTAQAALLEALALSLGWRGGNAPPLSEALRMAATVGFTELIVHRRYLTGVERDRLSEVLSSVEMKGEFEDGVVWYKLR